MKSSSPSKCSRFCGSEEDSMKYKDIISTLPKRENPCPTTDYYQYQGFWLSFHLLESTLSLQENFKARSSDTFICSSLKTGTTWLKALAFSIMTRDIYDVDGSSSPLQSKVPHQCMPTLEFDRSFANHAFLNTELPLLATHLPYSLLPKSIVSDSKCKIIYTCREPKDTFVSWWHYKERLKESVDVMKADTVPLEHEVKWFIEGKSPYGPYWDHVSEYRKANVDTPERVFFLKYENLKSDTLCYVNKLAEFMEKPFSKEEEKEGMAEKIVAQCDFKRLSNLEVNKSGWINPEPFRVNNSAYFRKGEIGDWKNLLTEDMAKSIDLVMQKKFQSLDLIFPQWLENNTSST